MPEYISIEEFEDSISLVFYIENDKVMAIGEKLQEINENAYMNGYNWEAVLNCYIENKAPQLMDSYEADPEAGMYAAYFENKEEAEAMADIIVRLIENEDELIEFVSSYGDEIEWD